MILHAVLCVVGFILLYFGADWLVKGASSLARSLGVIPIVIGLTVVAFGTSAPELLVSVVSAFQGQSMIAVGNVVGSNICNIALVLGMAALLHPLRSSMSVVNRDIPIMLGISLILLLLSLNNQLSRFEGIFLFTCILLYTWYNYSISNRQGKLADQGPSPEKELEQIGYVASRPKQLLLIVVGIAGVVGGAKLVVDSAVLIMTYLGVNEKFIGLTIVAFGTSLPELATSVVAALRKEMDISIGNLVGSNVFNILSVLGASAMIRPISIPGGFVASGLIIDYLVMLGTSFLPWLLMRRTGVLGRKGGALLLTTYLFYLVYLVATSTNPTA